MTPILFISLAFLIYSQYPLDIKNTDILYMIWWIFAFWYLYKRYERDKIIEMVNKLESIEIDRDINHLECKNRIDSLDIYYSLKEKWYIHTDIWEKIEQKYKIMLWNYWLDINIDWLKISPILTHVKTSIKNKKYISSFIIESISTTIPIIKSKIPDIDWSKDKNEAIKKSVRIESYIEDLEKYSSEFKNLISKN